MTAKGLVLFTAQQEVDLQLLRRLVDARAATARWLRPALLRRSAVPAAHSWQGEAASGSCCRQMSNTEPQHGRRGVRHGNANVHAVVQRASPPKGRPFEASRKQKEAVYTK
eukprot:TRINITY_DN451_c0_g1_i5.p7 TRINITY_DN451_c0_g1~~TRINITY_DN451_c0_g1_i5.p7  ORF type:complete len:111 (+),score=7.71 TRINITY_DN451_c0_g1_i5:1322-1654(+)